MKINFLGIGLVFVFYFYSPAHAAECRTASLPDGTPAMFCKDKSGNWKQQEGKLVAATPRSAADAVTAKGQATYRGTFSAAVSKRQRSRSQIDLSSLLNQAVNSNATRYQGAVNLVIKFDGAAVTAQLSGTGGIRNSTFTGLVQGGICRIVDAQNIEVWEGPCNQTRFSGTIKSTASNRNIVSGSFDTQASDYVDSAKRDAERSALKAECDAGRQTACVALDQMR
ncbi:hypothetical protein [Novosphingobium sp. B 225]|uniref:hypothetical protein n=1 Tax=Novosphingobium sp. B 225 TaxID=1961849 RepID=UPI000B4B4D01|nr:hypothetical protein [Novosphingobium sp. B 225]